MHDLQNRPSRETGATSQIIDVACFFKYIRIIHILKIVRYRMLSSINIDSSFSRFRSFTLYTYVH